MTLQPIISAVHGLPPPAFAAAGAPTAAEDPRDLHAYVIEDTAGSGFSCTLCGRTGVSRRDMRNHVESVHFPNMFTYECALCAVKLSSRKALDNHKYRHHRSTSN